MLIYQESFEVLFACCVCVCQNAASCTKTYQNMSTRRHKILLTSESVIPWAECESQEPNGWGWWVVCFDGTQEVDLALKLFCFPLHFRKGKRVLTAGCLLDLFAWIFTVFGGWTQGKSQNLMFLSLRNMAQSCESGMDGEFEKMHKITRTLVLSPTFPVWQQEYQLLFWRLGTGHPFPSSFNWSQLWKECAFQVETGC